MLILHKPYQRTEKAEMFSTFFFFLKHKASINLILNMTRILEERQLQTNPFHEHRRKKIQNKTLAN